MAKTTIHYVRNVLDYLATKKIDLAVDRAELTDAIDLLVTRDKRKANEYIVFMIKHGILSPVGNDVFDIKRENLP